MVFSKAFEDALETAPAAPLTPRGIRELLRLSQATVAVRSGVGPGLVRLYEVSPDAVADRMKRRALDRQYAYLRSELLSQLDVPRRDATK